VVNCGENFKRHKIVRREVAPFLHVGVEPAFLIAGLDFVAKDCAIFSDTFDESNLLRIKTDPTKIAQMVSVMVTNLF